MLETIKKNKFIFLFLIYIGVCAVDMFAAGTGGMGAIIDGGQQTKNDTKDMIDAYKWVIAIIVIIISLYPAKKYSKKIATKYEQSNGQEMPKAYENLAYVGVLIVAIAGCYFFIGLLFSVFAGSSFSNTWYKLVQEPIAALISL